MTESKGSKCYPKILSIIQYALLKGEDVVELFSDFCSGDV
jgi:hypothetical protein